jgi:hypothetical protein
MASASLDYMLSLVIFIAAILIFIGFFSQSLNTAYTYEEHNVMSTKTSDLLDTILLSPGLPNNWSSNDGLPLAFGLESSSGQYKLNFVSTMRLTSSTQAPVYYAGTSSYYNNLTAGAGACLLTPLAQTIDYAAASRMLGVNGTYGFRLTLTPTVTVDIEKTSSQGMPLQFRVNAEGTGFVVANANLTYNLLMVNRDAAEYPSYTRESGKASTDETGSAELALSQIENSGSSYALVVYTYLYGLKGVGCYIHAPQDAPSVVPIVESFQGRTIRLAHSSTIGESLGQPSQSQLSYNASFAVITEEYLLRQIPLDRANATAQIAYGGSQPQYRTVSLPPNDAGLLIITYKDTSTGQFGIALMPWGLGSLAFPLTFGGSSAGYDWVTTDIRQVTIGGIAYQAKLDLWSLRGHGGSR